MASGIPGYAVQCQSSGERGALRLFASGIAPLFDLRVRGQDGAHLARCFLLFDIRHVMGDSADAAANVHGRVMPLLGQPAIEHDVAVDQRTDLWAVGLLLYELLAGRSPLWGLNASQTYLKIVQGPLPPIEHRCPGLPTELAVVIHRCLQIDPAQRPQSADELIVALEPFCSRHAPSSAPLGPS